MTIERVNHLVLKVKDIDETCNFYQDVLGMEVDIISARKRALKFGNQKITIHQKGRGFDLEAQAPAPGPIDICFVVTESAEQIKAELESKNIQIEGMIQRPSATGKVTSVYFRDPDQNLIEVSSNT
jgi:catechol 2,3-dioxygenase-like lactoylglutathione lyase family enzyme